MILPTLARRDRYTALFGVGAVLSIVLLGRVLPSWIAWNHSISEAGMATSIELAESSVAVRRASLFDSAQAAGEKKLLSLARALLDGESVGLASATLTDVLTEAASDANVTLGAVQVQPEDESRGTIRTLHAHGDLDGDIAGVMAFTSTLEGALPLIAIRRLVVSTTNPAAGGDHAEAIHAEFVVDAIARIPNDSTGHSRPSGFNEGHSRAVQSFDLPRDRAVNVFYSKILDDAADSIIASDPFRLDRKPSAIPFGSQPLPPSPLPVRSRPQLVLGGIVGGPPWRALLAGVPGRDGSVVLSAGDTVGGLRVRSVGPREVVVASADTVWKLTVKQ